MYENIFKPIKIRDLEIKNRIVFAPTSMGYNEEEIVNKFINIAKGGTGLIIIGDISVRSSFHGGIKTLENDKNIEYFKNITDEVHKYGCKVSAQLFHPEYDVDYIVSLMRSNKGSREDLRRELKENTINYINNLSKEKINEIQEAYVKAAIRAEKAGFDMIQIHGDRLLGSFSSSIFNKREDEYGGSEENRVKMAVEIINRIRKKLPNMPIEYKIGIRKENPDIGKGGPLVSEVKTFVRLLDEAGVDSFHVAIANHSTIKDTIPAFNHEYLKGEGCFFDLAEEVKKYTNKVVCGVGKLKSPDFIENALKENIVDMFGLARQLIADDKWPNKVKEGRLEEIQYCRFCNVKCTNALMNHSEFGCVLHK